jgi:hypothetical protein
MTDHQDDQPSAARDFLKWALARARWRLDCYNSIDETDDLLRISAEIPRAEWPAELVEFVKTWKRPRGRLKSRKAHFYHLGRSPSHLAASIAAATIDDSREADGRRPYKRDGKLIIDEAIRWAVELVNSGAYFIGFRAKANEDAVRELLRQGRAPDLNGEDNCYAVDLNEEDF